MKRTQGRQKIQMELIRDPNALQVCFSKRRKGLVKKVFELCVLCDAQVALVVFSPAGKPYSFAHPSFPAVVDRFLNPQSAPAPAAAAAASGTDQLARLSELQREAERLADAVHEAKEVRGKELEAMVRAAGVWVDGDLSRCGAPQLEAALAALLGVQAEAAQRAHEILAQEAMVQQQQQQQCLAADGIGSSHGGNLFDYLGSYAAADHGHGGDLFDYLGSGGPYYAPDAMGSSHGNAHEAAAMDNGTDLMCNDAGSFFHYLGSSSGSFMADGGGGGGNHGEVGAVDTNIRLMGGGGMNHGLVPMMPLPPPQPPALPFNHGGFDYYNLGYNNQGDLGHGRGGAFYEMDGVYGTTCSFL
ncbi:hypothetical protein BRADI_3g04880v3 [Brachypodium distachyon]|nr:hypothetical protein BRADI_3g04880v3 [Brachypodium distachyon]